MFNEGSQFSRPDDGSEIANVRQDDSGDVTLTLKREKFAEFLFEFLGPRETFSKSYKREFIINLEDILQFHYLLEGKIKKEQFISLSMMTATIQYDDGTNRTVNTIEAITKFNEYRDVAVISFSIVWQFIYRVPDENIVRQQKVSLFFDTRSIDSQGTIIGSVILVSIEHTNQVWAVEVQRMFEEQIHKIQVRYSSSYILLDFLSKFKVFGILLSAATFSLVVGSIYIVFQHIQLLDPIKVEAEFMFDLADIIAQEKLVPRKNINQPERERNILLQFFLIRDLRQSDPHIIGYLREHGYFDEKYAEVIAKLESGYYHKNTKSEKLSWIPELKLEELQRIKHIEVVFTGLKILVLYIFFYLSVFLYLNLFRFLSIIAISSKSVRLLKEQYRRKSNARQLLFGVLASLIAAVIIYSAPQF